MRLEAKLKASMAIRAVASRSSARLSVLWQKSVRNLPHALTHVGFGSLTLGCFLQSMLHCKCLETLKKNQSREKPQMPKLQTPFPVNATGACMSQSSASLVQQPQRSGLIFCHFFRIRMYLIAGRFGDCKEILISRELGISDSPRRAVKS